MGSFSRNTSAVIATALVSGCAALPMTVEEGAIEIGEVTRAIECELAAVANDPRLTAYNVRAWRVKSNLDLTLVTKVGADGKVVWAIPHSPSPVKLTPSLSLSRRNYRNAHLDFVTSIKDAAQRYHECMLDSRYSEYGLGLGSWLTSTLISIEQGKHAGMSYTTEFEVNAAPAARLGYTLTRVDVDAGVGGSWTGTNRLTVAVAPPAGDPVPIPVYTVPPPESAAKLTTARPKTIPRPSVKDDPTLNRLLDRQAPLRLEPR